MSGMNGGFRAFRVQRKVFEDAAGSICSLYLVPDDEQPLPAFEPGQHLTFRFTVMDPDTGQPRIVHRCYSLSDRPGLDHYRVTIKRVAPFGLVSSHVFDHVREGALLLAQPPSGRFVLDRGDAPVVLIAGGIGITPMLSMLHAIFGQGASSREIWLFYGVRNSAEQVFGGQLRAWAARYPRFHLCVSYSRPLPADFQGEDFHHAGHVDITLLRQTLMSPAHRFYVCGPAAMMEALPPALRAWGVPEGHLHFESFGSFVVPDQGSAFTAGTITFARSGTSMLWDEQAASLLDFAEQNGIDVASGCRAGVCGTCQTVILAGEVEYLHSPDYTPDPGSGLLCITKPKGDLSLLA